MFDLDKENGSSKESRREESSFREPTREELKTHKQKEHNRRQKTLMKVIGENMASYACVLILFLLVGLIWTDIGLFVNFTSFITDALVSIVLFILADICMAQIGTKGGKLDDDYLKVHDEYLTLRDTVRKAGISLMDMFCDWQIDIEYEFYMRRRCKTLKIEYKTWSESYSKMELDELKRIMSIDKAAKVFALNQVRHIELTPDILLTDGRAQNERGGVGQSGEEYIAKHTTGWQHILTTALFAIIAAVPVFTLTNDVSVGRVIYTLFKLSMMFYRMFKGYNRGAMGYNTVEPKHIQDKIKYLHLYLEFVEKKMYLKLKERYDFAFSESESLDETETEHEQKS